MRQAERDEAFSEYVASRQDRLRRVAYAMCGSWHQSEDLLQTAFTKLYVAWPRLSRAGVEDAYVRRIILNALLDERRRPSSRELPGLPDHDRADPAAPTGPVVEVRDELVQALQQLPPMQRRTVVLRHVADLSVEQVAHELGISVGTVKSHTSRGLARLQELLASPAQNPGKEH
jgi:RNA polymerase sigma-70 factor (sigma-E family)